MYRHISDDKIYTINSPRICGDVSIVRRYTEFLVQFSPHVRGRFHANTTGYEYETIFPACAGMRHTKMF